MNSSPISPVGRTKAEARAAYDRLSRWYDLIAASEAPFRARALALLGPHEGERLLEIGFGTGGMLLALAEKVGPRGWVAGLDLSAGMAAQAIRRLRGTGRRVTICLGDGAALPFPCGTFDGILLTFTLELFETTEIPIVLGECRRALRDGGRISIAALNQPRQPTMPTRLYEWFHRLFPAAVDCRPIPLVRLLKESGYAVDAVREEMMWGLPVTIARGL